MLRDQKGFSMLELMIGLLIMTILIVAVVSVGSSSVKKSRNFGTMRDLNIYVNAAELYILENIGENLTEDGLNKFLDSSYKFVDGESIRRSPWKKPYIISHINNASFNYPAKIHFLSPFENGYSYWVDLNNNSLHGAAYYFRGEAASCVTSSPELNQDDLLEVFHVFGEQIEGFDCGYYPEYNK